MVKGILQKKKKLDERGKETVTNSKSRNSENVVSVSLKIIS